MLKACCVLQSQSQTMFCSVHSTVQYLYSTSSAAIDQWNVMEWIVLRSEFAETTMQYTNAVSSTYEYTVQESTKAESDTIQNNTTVYSYIRIKREYTV